MTNGQRKDGLAEDETTLDLARSSFYVVSRATCRARVESIKYILKTTCNCVTLHVALFYMYRAFSRDRRQNARK